MKKYLIVCVLLISFGSLQAQFDHYFLDKSLRIDFTHAGTDSTEWFALDELIEEPFWGGSKTKLIDTFLYGEYQVKVFDEKTSELLYSRGFSSLFGEWQTTIESKQMCRSFNETTLIPYPKNPVIITLNSRNHDGVSEEKFSLRIDPESYFIRPAKPSTASVFDVQINAPSDKAVDIVILGDGYTAAEMGTFIADCEHFGEMMFGFEPFKSWQKSFNIRAVMVTSAETGSRIPGDKIYPSTALSSSYYTFDSERYCMTYDPKAVRDFAGLTPYDQIYILVNSEKYGGGGIYNFYSLSASRNKLSGEIIVHEFGHGFAGLGDEYFDSSTSYNDFYNPLVEPWEPNLTTMVNFDSKWEKFVGDSIPVPTPAIKRYSQTIGVFEGGGYVAKGVFRPRQDCLMHTFKGHTFCAVCEDAIIQMIRFYTE